ncbi:hypothetical protein GCM10008967_20160 [Bacillus carboniphilus]|uniref:PDZ domain-containing protein n=1 Tax=Bacillus carboniphilus TaxID=86663 RepID=A0ABN0W972_9BACI
MEEKITSVKRDIVIKVPVERVWRALITPSERNKWETRSCEMDLRIGGVATFDYGWGVSYSAKIVDLVENERIVFEGEDNHQTIWSVEAHSEGTKLTVEYTGLWIGDLGLMQADNMVFGTYQFMRNLKSVMENEMDIRQTFWKSWIGALHRTVEEEGVKGVKVVQLIKDTPAAIELQIGDIIVQVNETNVERYEDLEILVTEIGAEQRLTLDIIRNSEKHKVKLSTLPYGQKLEENVLG